MLDIVIFSVEEHYYALPVAKVVHVIWALELTQMPQSPKIVCGVFDFHGKTIPVISFRTLFSLAEKILECEDALIIVELHGHQMALLCDHIIGVFALNVEEAIEAQDVFPQLKMTQVVKYEERLIPLLDLETLIDHEIAMVNVTEGGK